MRILGVVLFSVWACLISRGAPDYKILASDAKSSAEFGVAVAAFGNTALVGAWRNDTINLASGTAYILERNSETGAFIELRKLAAGDPGAGDGFGAAVALQGAVGLVGASGDDERGSDAGAAYIIERDLGGANLWGQRKKLLGSDVAPSASFGTSVVLAQTVAVAGAPLTGSGAAYIFEQNSGGANAWGEVKKVVSAEAPEGSHFGEAVAADGDIIAVGAPLDSDAAVDAGAVYIFARNQGGPNNWGQVIKLLANDAAIGLRFGSALAMRGTLLAVGATEEGVGPGAVYLFDRNMGGPGEWGQVRKLTASEPVDRARFGASLSMDEDLLLVGAPYESKSGMEAGAAYIFHLSSADQYRQLARLFGSDATAGSRLGGAVALTGRSAFAGALGDNQAGEGAGAVYQFDPAVGDPAMTIRASGSTVFLHWTPNSPGYVLETTSSLTNSTWQELAFGGFPAAYPQVGNIGFYRLRSLPRVDMAFVPVGNLGNVNDSTAFGKVDTAYQIGTFEVSNEQYARFLNMVARTNDPAGLFNPAMMTDARGGISKSTAGAISQYTVKANMGNKPVNFVSYFDALRFVNWLHNGQPVGNQTTNTTEAGAYTFTAATTVGARLATAKVWLPNEDEWYKAAYYDPTKGDDGGYWLYPTRSDTTPSPATANATGDISNPGSSIANFDNGASWNGQTGNVTTVGSAGIDSRSYYGGADLGGNVSEWTDTSSGAAQVRRGGSWTDFEAGMEATNRSAEAPATENATIGFRVARP